MIQHLGKASATRRHFRRPKLAQPNPVANPAPFDPQSSRRGDVSRQSTPSMNPVIVQPRPLIVSALHSLPLPQFRMRPAERALNRIIRITTHR